MANIRGVNDYREGLLGNASLTSAMLIQGLPMGTSQSAREESFWSMMKSITCPFLQAKSFTSLICLINTFLFLATCFYDSDPGLFLVPSSSSLVLFGARDNEKLRKLQIWRWLTPVFLHANFNHFFINTVFILAFVSRVEYGVSRKNCIIVYFITAVAGNLLGAISSNNLAVGASTAIFGTIGAMIGWIGFNWRALSGNDSRLPSLIVLILIAVFNLMIGGFQKEVDNFGHLGGLVVGGFLALALFAPLVDGERERKLKKVGIAGTVIALAGGVAGFYFKM